jgi:S1-C subfamily serine protease
VIGMAAINKIEGKGLGFAIPVETIHRGFVDLLEPEVNQRLHLGMTMKNAKPFVVVAIAPSSPVLSADIQAGDEITHVDGKPLRDLGEMYVRLLAHRPGDEILFTRARNGIADEVRVKVRAVPQSDVKAGLSRFGLKAEPLTIPKANAMHMRVPKGVVITDVQSDLFKDHAPKPGDVLARINEVRPANLEKAGELLAEAKPGQPLHLVFLRQKEKEVFRYDVTVTPGR